MLAQALAAKLRPVPVLAEAGWSGAGCGGDPFERMLRSLFMVSNQKGAPSMVANAVIAKPRSFSNHQEKSVVKACFTFVQEKPDGQPNGSCLNCSRSLSCCLACSDVISVFAFPAAATTLSRRKEFCQRARNMTKLSAFSATTSAKAMPNKIFCALRLYHPETRSMVLSNQFSISLRIASAS